MASRALTPAAAPLDLLLASIPSLSRAILARLTARMIERLDELDGDTDLEPDGDDTACDDGPVDGETDTEGGSWPEQVEQNGLREYRDDDHEDDAAEVRRPHCKRIRATRCEKTVRFGYSRFSLTGSAADVIGLQP